MFYFFCIVIIILGFGGILQILKSPLFGLYEPTKIETDFWFLYTCFQFVLFGFSVKDHKIKKMYIITQAISIIITIFVVFRNIKVFNKFLFLFLIFFAIIYLINKFIIKKSNLYTIISNVVIFIPLYILIISVISLPFLYSTSVKYNDLIVAFNLIVSLIVSLFVLSRLRIISYSDDYKIHNFLPFSFILIIILISLAPHDGYDALNYKATNPYIIFYWRSALTTALEPTLLTTNLQEIIIGNLIIFDKGFYSPYISLYAYIIAFFTLQILLNNSCIKLYKLKSDTNIRFLFSIGIVMTEALNSAGTSYYEPLILALLFLSLIPLLGVIFLSASFAVKATSLFIFPFMLFIYLKNQSLKILFLNYVTI